MTLVLGFSAEKIKQKKKKISNIFCYATIQNFLPNGQLV
jgi:hypothetical protein